MAVEVKLNPLGLVDPRQQKAVIDAKNKASTPKPKPPTNPAPFTQTLNLYGSPASNAARTPLNSGSSKSGGSSKPSGGSKSASKPAPGVNQAALDASSARLQAEADAYFAANPDIDPITGQRKTTVSYPEPEENKKIPAVKEIIPNVAYDTIQKILESYRITGLASVLETIRDEYPEASSEELITLLQFDSRYNTKFNERFAGNVTRLKAGKPVLSPGEYLKLEQAYEKVFTSYNLPKFKTQSYYDGFITSDVDPTEVTERVQLAYDRVMGDEPVLSAFKKFYSSLNFSDIVGGMLDPVNQLPALQQKVKAAEIGGAALRQGFTASELATTAATTTGFSNVTTSNLGADVLARQGVTKEEAEAGYQDIARILPTAEKLSSIYGESTGQYGLKEAEQERFQGLASAERKRLELAKLELAQFTGRSGLAKSALSDRNNF